MELSSLSPIAVLGFNRADKLKVTLQSLERNKLAGQSDLFIFVDGPRENKIGEDIKVREVIEVAKSTTGFKSVEICTSEKNKGLEKSITGAASMLLERYGKVIIVEDDLYLAPSFLVYMNQMLQHFENDKRVFQVSGYSSLINKKKDSDVYLNARGQCWTWGTWKDRWDTIDWNISDFESFKNDKKNRKEWAKYGHDLFGFLSSWKAGRLNSWWIRFSYNMFKQHRYTVCPMKSLVRNDGFGADSTHCNVYDRYKIEFDNEEHEQFFIPENLEWDERFNRHATRYWSLPYRVYGKLMTYYYRGTSKKNSKPTSTHT